MNNNIGISDMTTGIDSTGMQNYVESLKLHLLQEVKDDIDDVQSIVDTINSGWQGVSRDRFLASFEKARESIKADLDQEFNNVVGRLSELQTNYFKQDENMVQE